MTIPEISDALRQKHADFLSLLAGMSDDALVQAPAGKWSAVQQLDHLRRSVRPVRLAFTLPRWLLGAWQGKPNRPGRTFEALVLRYQQKLASGGRASGAFVPPALAASACPALRKALQKEVDGLCGRLERMTEAQLDGYLLPHPLLGKLTLREMLYFTIYHVQHHQRIVAGYSGAALDRTSTLHGEWLAVVERSQNK